MADSMRLTTKEAMQYLGEAPGIINLNEDLSAFEELLSKDPAVVAKSLREAYEELESVDKEIKSERKGFSKKNNDRGILEELYSEKMSLLYRMACSTSPLSSYGVKCLQQAMEARLEFENIAGVYTTRITQKNIRVFMHVLTEDIAEEIWVGKMEAIGAVRTEKGQSYGVAALVYRLDDSMSEEEAVLRIEWLYVHRHFRGRGVADSLIGEMAYLMKKSDISAMTASFSVGLTWDPVIAQTFADWGFMFGAQMEPDTIIRISDITEIDKIKKYAAGVRPLTDIEKKNIPAFLERALEEDEYSGYLWRQTRNPGYIDPELSCYTGDKRSPEGVLMTHRTPSGIYKVEYIHLRGNDERVVLNMCAWFIYRVIATGKGDDILDIPVLMDELGRFLDKLVPIQRSALLVTGVLADSYNTPDIDENMVEEMLCATDEELKEASREMMELMDRISKGIKEGAL